jgi:hypothetical protein
MQTTITLTPRQEMHCNNILRSPSHINHAKHTHNSTAAAAKPLLEDPCHAIALLS